MNRKGCEYIHDLKMILIGFNDSPFEIFLIVVQSEYYIFFTVLHDLVDHFDLRLNYCINDALVRDDCHDLQLPIPYFRFQPAGK